MYFQPQQPGGGIPNPNQQPPNPQQQAAMARMIRPNLGPGPHSHHSQMSPNVAASPAQPIQQMGGVYPHPGSTGGPIPFSPQQQHGGMGGGPSAAGVYSQQMMTPMGSMGQPHSQQMLGSNNPMSVSDAPATPATPQQQQQLQQPHSIGSHLQQPGSVQQLQQPSSIGPIPMATPNPAASAGGGGGGPFLSGTAPSSVGSITSAGGRPTQQSQQPPPTQIPAQPTLPELDPIAAAKMLILKDLRKAIVEFNQCAEKSVERMLSTEPTTTTTQSVGGGMVPSSSEKQQHEEKKMMTTAAAAGMPSAGGPHSNLGPGGPHSIGGPQSNLGFGGPHSVNPHSVQNPLSVQNPQSVNPQSVSAIPPGSVKSASADEAGISGRKDLVELSPNEQYEMARDQFLNVCDNIERNMALILEVNRQQGKLYNPQANTAVAWLQMPSELNEPTSTLPQVLHGFAELMNADKQAIKSNIDGLNSLMERVNNGQKKE